MTGHAVSFGVLGPVEATAGAGPVPLKGPRQRAVLARLLIAHGRVVPVDMLVGDLWDEPPPGALAAIRTFVSDLRRALEPGRQPRQPARLLASVPPGYVLRAEPEAVDAWRFEAHVGEAAPMLAAGRAAEALSLLDGALAMWRGPAYADVADQGWARAAIDRLDELRMLAVERRAEALLALGRAADAAFDLRAHADAHPLREDAWRLLATALYRAGRQGDALAVLRRVRRALVSELGVDPGPRLQRLETDLLAQAPHLDPPPSDSRHPDLPPVSPGGRAGGPAVRAAAGDRRPFVGRDAELAELTATAEGVLRRASPALVLVSGEAGGGKTALVEALAHRLARQGWSAVWGRSPDYDGAPVTWPWARDAEEPAGDPAVARLHRRRAALAFLAAAAGRGPLLLVADDLHRADESSLDVLTALVGGPVPSGPVLVVGTYRATEITPELTGALARLAAAEPVRVYLGGLTEAATGELVRAVTGDVDPPAERLVHRRSGGNPFFVRELARLLATDGGAALHDVPAGVRDVLRHRLARLPEAARTVLRQASVLGLHVDPELLTALTGDDTAVLDALDSALRAGFLTETGADGRHATAEGLRFTHVLVRDTLYGDLSAPRRSRWHTTVAETLERLRPDDVTALAHHFARAASRGTAPRAAAYARKAAEQAERRSDPHEAARLWRLALLAHDRATAPADRGDAGRADDDRVVPDRVRPDRVRPDRVGPDRAGADGDLRWRLEAVMGLGRALAVTGHLDEARRHRAASITAAERLGDPELTAAVITAFDVPAVWTRNDDEDLSGEVVRAAEDALARLGDDRDALRSRLLSTIALEVRGTTTDRGDRAAREAETIARRTGDPALLALALNARFMHTFTRTGLAAERARIGAELVGVAARHGLVTFEVLGHLVLLQARSALGDVAAADAHAKAADDLAATYELPVVGVITGWYAALRLALDGRRAEAEAAYRSADARLSGGGMPGMADGLLPLALLTLGTPPAGTSGWGPYEPWVRPLMLLADGRRDEAAAALQAQPEPPHDLLLEARLCLTARAAIALGDRSTMRRVHTHLLPAAHEIAGAGSGVLGLGPVAGHLDELRSHLGAARSG